MALTLVATPGDATANSFLTVEEADGILAGRLFIDAWDDADPDEKAAALVWATNIIGVRTCWSGAATYEDQALTWPRTGMLNRNGFVIAEDAIPYDLKVATAELALKLLSADLTADKQSETDGLKRVKAGPIEVEWKDKLVASALPAIVAAWLVPSWLCPVPSTVPPFIFEAV